MCPWSSGNHDLEEKFMRCPTDSATLVMSERGGVEIDYRPECRGIWLDRGELDKILDRAEKEFAAAAAAQAPAAPVILAAARQQEEQQYPAQHQRSPQHSPQYGERSDRESTTETEKGTAQGLVLSPSPHLQAAASEFTRQESYEGQVEDGEGSENGDNGVRATVPRGTVTRTPPHRTRKTKA
jgi:Zn-finger nucleic acid-binding protein